MKVGAMTMKRKKRMIIMMMKKKLKNKKKKWESYNKYLRRSQAYRLVIIIKISLTKTQMEIKLYSNL
jgi:hypothetical protein